LHHARELFLERGYTGTTDLSPAEQSSFAEELIAARSDAAELTIDRRFSRGAPPQS
jgi:hypothetical protein